MKKYLFLCILIAVFSCNKEDDYDLHKYPGLPDATRSGQNTMGCLINGKPWVANFPAWSHFGPVDVRYGEYRKNIDGFDSLLLENHFILSEDLSCPTGFCRNDYFLMLLQPVQKVGILDVSKLKNKRIDYSYELEMSDSSYVSKTYILDELVTPYFEITQLDTVHNIVSGLFDFRLKRISDYKDTVHISQGRFDAEYLPK